MKGHEHVRHAFIFIVSYMLLAAPAPGHQPGSSARPIVIRNVSVIDVMTGTIRGGVTVTISNQRIKAIEPGARSEVASDARVVDGSGKFLIPGLWDMHVHWYDERFLPLFTANGVTGIRQMWGQPVHFDWRERVKSQRLTAPRQYIASTIVDGPSPVWPGSLVVTNDTEARSAVEKLQGLGFDFIKVYERLSRDAYFAIAAEAKARGLSFGGHVPRSITALEAAKVGQRSIEHLSGVLLGTSSLEGDLKHQRAELLAGGRGMNTATRDAMRALDERLLATYDETKASTLFAAFVAHGTWHCPTLTVLRSLASLDDPAFTADPRLKYMPVSIRNSWMPTNDVRFASKGPADYAMGKRLFGKNLEVVGAMRRAGVKFLAGTDALNPFAFPGFSLHDELELLVEAGLTPLEAIQSATINAAEYVGQSREVGTIEVGKAADVVLLDANPLAKIANTKRIAAVVIGGQLLQRAELDRVLTVAERTANLKSISDTLFRMIETKGIAAAVVLYQDLRANARETYDFHEDELNELGYRLVEGKKVADAIEVFRLNVEAYPNSANVYDSLAEAYAVAGKVPLAIENYEKSLQLNPKNESARTALQKLRNK